MFFSFKYHLNLFLIISFFILLSCKLQEPTKNQGVLYLQNRSEKLIINETNTNDVINILGNPHTRSVSNENEWFYIERILTKGEFFKLGQNVLKENNILVLNFNKYGILKEKIFIDKNSKNKLKFSSQETRNEISQKSFLEKFLQSLKQKMYKK